MAGRGAASMVPLLLLSLLVLGRALLGRIELVAHSLPGPWAAVALPAVAAALVIISVLHGRRGFEEACFTALSSSYSSVSEVIAETRWLEEALRRVSKEGGRVRAVYEDGVYRVCIRARDASRLVSYLREFSSNILIMPDYSSNCRRVVFSRLDEVILRYLDDGAVIVLAKRYTIDDLTSCKQNVRIIDISNILDINKKIVKIINEINSIKVSGFTPKRLVFVDLVEAEPSSVFSLLRTRGVLPPGADCVELINSVEQQILTS